MAMIKPKEARKLSSQELDKRLGELRLEIAKEKANIAIGAPVSSPGKLGEMKRSVARILTVKREKIHE